MTNPSEPAWRPIDLAFAFVMDRDLETVLAMGIQQGPEDYIPIFGTEDEARQAGIAIIGDRHSVISIDLAAIPNPAFHDTPWEAAALVTPISGRLTHISSSIPAEAISEIPKSRLGL